MAATRSYLAQVPHGMGIYIPKTVESIAASSFVWRRLNKPDFWIDGDYRRRGEDGYVPMLPMMEWGSEASRLAEMTWPGEFWLQGHEIQQVTHPTDAANFSHEWRTATDTLVGAPGVRIDEDGIKWLDEYVTVGGHVPDAWHIHITQPWPQWKHDYYLFQTWMRRRMVMRPVVVTQVEATGLQSGPQKALLKEVVRQGLFRTHYLSAIVWKSAYTPDRWGATLVTYAMGLSALGKLWVKLQKEFRDEVTSDRPRPAWQFVGGRDRGHDGRPSRRSLDG